jgi:hypothetical protein
MMRGRVGPREVDAWTLRFASGERARVWIGGEARRRLDCVALNAAGHLLDVDSDTTGRCELTWMPDRTGNYRIMIRNADSVASAYELLVR